MDAGALIAMERGDRDLIAAIKGHRQQGLGPMTHAGILAQVWRGGSRQTLLAGVLPILEIVALDADLGRQTGLLLQRAHTSDVLDAALVAIASDGDEIITSDPDDLAHLADAAGIWVRIVRR